MKQYSYRGVAQIILFNWHQYVVGVVACALAIWMLGRVSLQPLIRIVGEIGVGLAAFWLAASLIASHYVYDRSGLETWDWVRPLFPTTPVRWVNIHCGFDETTVPLRRVFPNTESTVLDIFDECEMTEASIRRARRHDCGAPAPMRARFNALPSRTGEMLAVFVIFAAHEIRKVEARRAFFRELNRVLAPGGRLLLVEHLRDGWNFAAFGPGCWHFLPRREWIQRAHETGFAVEREFRKTPFVRVWLLRKERDTNE